MIAASYSVTSKFRREVLRSTTESVIVYGRFWTIM
jgi:hypothetical protein